MIPNKLYLLLLQQFACAWNGIQIERRCRLEHKVLRIDKVKQQPSSSDEAQVRSGQGELECTVNGEQCACMRR